MQIVVNTVWIDLWKKKNSMKLGRIQISWAWRIEIPPPYRTRALSCAHYAKSNSNNQNQLEESTFNLKEYRFHLHLERGLLLAEEPVARIKEEGCVLQSQSDAHLLPNMQIIAATLWIDLQESTIG